MSLQFKQSDDSGLEYQAQIPDKPNEFYLITWFPDKRHWKAENWCDLDTGLEAVDVIGCFLEKNTAMLMCIHHNMYYK